ncbi:hypothetical protein OPT61_g6880 [Boeremia exigua]|uniref:Uncharacterized protein n=1 Tax=Boeremia exigua TaxID=749465 RepID=A0ACC2I5Y0_9PLEO|nr:hypothetical protein OPT61_g6880 [Boeremia exigua]
MPSTSCQPSLLQKTHEERRCIAVRFRVLSGKCPTTWAGVDPDAVDDSRWNASRVETGPATAAGLLQLRVVLYVHVQWTAVPRSTRTPSHEDENLRGATLAGIGFVSRLLYVQRTQRLKPLTLHLAVHLLDRILAERHLEHSEDSFHLLVTIPVKIASDYNEDARFRLERIWLGSQAWYEQENEQVSAVLGRRLNWPGPFMFLDEYLASTVCSRSDVSTLRALAAFLLEASLFNETMVSQLPSVVAAAAYYVAVAMLEGAPWTPDMERVSKHSFLDVYPVMQSLCRSYGEDCRFVVALDESVQEMADFAMIKLAKGFVVSLVMTPVSAGSREEMQRQLTRHRL